MSTAKNRILNKYTRLCADSFVRQHGGHGYILNQLTTADRLYDASGAAFLAALSREAQTLDQVAEKVASSFVGVTATDILPDLLEFLETLAETGFVLLGDSPESLDAAEPHFDYKKITEIKTAKEKLALLTDAEKSQNVSDTQKELQAIFADKPVLYDLQIELTSACNERCRHCYLPPEREQRHADTALVKKTIDDFSAMGGLTITFGGGECLLHPNFCELLAYARARDLSVSLLSNLTALDDKKLEAIKAARISQLQVSVYSLNADEHDHITTVKGSLAKTLASIEKLVAANVPLQVSAPTMRTNYASYKDVLPWARERGMKAQTDFIMMARSDFSTDNLVERLNDAETEKLLKDILSEDFQYRELIEDPEHQTHKLDAPVCGVGRGTLTVGANGLCFPCSGWQGMVVGSLLERSLSEIWEASPTLAQLRTITKGDFPECVKCADRDYCAMCMVRNFNESQGDMMKINRRFCEVAHINRILVEEWKTNRKKEIKK